MTNTVYHELIYSVEIIEDLTPAQFAFITFKRINILNKHIVVATVVTKYGRYTRDGESAEKL